MAGAPEEIRTPDPQIRSLALCFDPAQFFCKLEAKADIAHQYVNWSFANRIRLAQTGAVPCRSRSASSASTIQSAANRAFLEGLVLCLRRAIFGVGC
jgi:hypothetical protein